MSYMYKTARTSGYRNVAQDCSHLQPDPHLEIHTRTLTHARTHTHMRYLVSYACHKVYPLGQCEVVSCCLTEISASRHVKDPLTDELLEPNLRFICWYDLRLLYFLFCVTFFYFIHCISGVGDYCVGLAVSLVTR